MPSVGRALMSFASCRDACETHRGAVRTHRELPGRGARCCSCHLLRGAGVGLGQGVGLRYRQRLQVAPCLWHPALSGGEPRPRQVESWLTGERTESLTAYANALGKVAEPSEGLAAI